MLTDLVGAQSCVRLTEHAFLRLRLHRKRIRLMLCRNRQKRCTEQQRS